LTWSEIKKGPLIYEIGDLGALLVFSAMVNITDTLLFSWNEGLTFSECKFSTLGAIDVTNIVVDPDFASEQFILFGMRPENNAGFLVHLDFSGLHERSCVASDYEMWTSGDSAGSTCQLGKHTTYSRRKRTSECYNPPSYQPTVTSTPCACTREDYECDYCFEPQPDGTCAPVCGSSYNVSAPPAPCNGYYYISRGYRFVAGDGCSLTAPNSLNLTGIRTVCPASPSTSSTDSGGNGGSPISGIVGAVIAILVIGFVIVLAGAAFYGVKKTQKPEFLYNLISRVMPSSTSDSKYSRVNLDEPGDELEEN